MAMEAVSQAKTKHKTASTTVATTRATTTTSTTTTTTRVTTTTAMPKRPAKVRGSAHTSTGKPGVFLAKEQKSEEREELKRELYAQVKAEMEKEFQAELKQQLAEARAKMDTLAKVTAARSSTTSALASVTTSTATSTKSVAATSTTVELTSTKPLATLPTQKASLLQEDKQAMDDQKSRATLAAEISAHTAEQDVEEALRSQAFGTVESQFNVFDMPTYQMSTTTTTTTTTASTTKLKEYGARAGLSGLAGRLVKGVRDELLVWAEASPVHGVWARIDDWLAHHSSSRATTTTSKPVQRKAEALIQSPRADSTADQAKWEAERLRDNHVEDMWSDFESQDSEFQAQLDKEDATEQN